MTYQQARKVAGLSTTDAAEKLRRIYPKASRAGVSMAERPDMTGITFTTGAREILDDAYSNAGAARVDRRKDRARVSCHLSDADRAAFNAGKAARGCITDREYIEYLIHADQQAIKEGAAMLGHDSAKTEMGS